MRALILHPIHASASKPGDAGEFRREAQRLVTTLQDGGWSTTRVPFNNALGKGARRREVERAIASGGPWDVIALFSHGLARGIQTGHDLATVSTLAEALAAPAGPSRRLVVTLYACDAADSPGDGPGGDGGFADALRDALSERGVTGHVDAHVTTGHTTRNPYVRRFYMDGVAVGTGGDWLVAPGSPKWRKWVTALKGDMRFSFPWMTPGEIDAAL